MVSKRSFWKGFITVGLLNVPVKLITMREDKKLSAHMYRASDMSRIKMPKVAEKDGAVVPDAGIVYGYEIDGGKEVVILTKDEKNAAKPESDRKIKIVGFVPMGEIDEMFFDAPYILVPDGMPEAYSLLLEAIRVRGEAGIGRITIREREYTALIHAYRGGLVLSTLKYMDEVIVPSEVDDLKKLPAVDGDQLNMAVSILDALRASFDLSQYRDGAREKLAAIIDAKRRGEEIVAPKPEAVKPTALMEALKAELARVEAEKARANPPAPHLEVQVR